MELTLSVWRCPFETHLAALLWTFSVELIPFQCRESRMWLHTQTSVEQGLCTQFPLFLFADLEVAPEEAKCLVGDGVDMGTPFNVVLGVDTKLLCGGDIFNSMSCS